MHYLKGHQTKNIMVTYGMETFGFWGFSIGINIRTTIAFSVRFLCFSFRVAKRDEIIDDIYDDMFDEDGNYKEIDLGDE